MMQTGESNSRMVSALKPRDVCLCLCQVCTHEYNYLKQFRTS